jgi:hypothetical protein
MIKCPVHGNVGIALVSPDLSEAQQRSVRWPEFFCVEYVLYGDVLLTMYISEVFAGNRSIAERGQVELPKDYPSWVRALVPECWKCAHEADLAQARSRPSASPLGPVE